MNIFDRILHKTEFYNDLYNTAAGGYTPISVTGVAGIHKAHIAAALAADTSVLLVCADEAAAVRAAQDINTLADRRLACVFPEKEFVFVPMEGVSNEYVHRRIEALSLILTGECRVLCCSAAAACQATVPPDVLEEYSFRLEVGGEINTDTLIRRLTAAGYSRCEMVEGQAQFSVRGSVVDIFPVSDSEPVRIELWGDEIDSAARFDTETQRRTEPVDCVTVFPALEVIFGSQEEFCERIDKLSQSLRMKNADAVRAYLMRDREMVETGLSLTNPDKYYSLAYETSAFVTDYFSKGVCLVSEYTSACENLRGFSDQLSEDLKLMYESGIMFKRLEGYMADSGLLEAKMLALPCIFLDTFMRQNGSIRFKKLINTDCRQTAGWGGSMTALTEELNEYIGQGYSVVLLAGSEKTLPIIVSDLCEDGFRAEILTEDSEPEAGRVYVRTGSLSSGVDYPTAGCAVITQMKSANIVKKKKKRKNDDVIRALTELHPGDLVVHSIHGIGRFRGIESIAANGVKKDYITIKYSGTDVLYVPVTQLDLVSRYVGASDDTTVKLSRLGSIEWQKTRSRVKKAVRDMAEELTKLYAQRQTVFGHAFSPDNDWQRDFEDRFDYQETDDQLRCINEIKEDMEKVQPMDRLLCGDVGFGKTEVALRAAFKCVLDSKQAAILVPTTVLAWQHYQTAIKRFEHFPIKVELLSRFRTPQQQAQIVRELKRGTIDVIIGTHRLVSKDVGFKDLGLVIIDEEQRFGVAAKEKLKELFTGVDVLTLSATPIPRTLNMALSGIRDMSVIEEPPQDRRPIQTYVTEHSPAVIGQAISKELRRGGQVYYIHNRIDTIYRTADEIAKLVPGARVGVAHGRLSEHELSEIWRQLIEGEIDVLVCTTLIETGVDVPNVNTLIIEDADYLGLSQMHQLRGRVGRSSRRAYAYLTFRRGKVLSEVATKRLEAIKEFTKFGSGFHIAMRDLEIRGAGSILSGRQHGHMEAVGYDLYLQLLNEAIAEQKGEAPPPSPEDCLIDIMIDAFIPETYIESDMLRIDAYRRIASIVSVEDSRDVIDEFIDRFGDPPKPVMGLINVALVRNSAAALGIREISQKGAKAVFTMREFKPEYAPKLLEKYGKRLRFIQGDAPGFSIDISAKQPTAELITEVVAVMRGQDGKPDNVKKK
ncbi:transcription-repair coupling factor (superfamily II helicase) [Ruminococcus sp. YE71]|uniref:transcription-repair coupling factor n=1 Tax=unclassified Ruminococcus TaxID=2608920 RepID=UPI00088084E3|nr:MULTISPECIES: transcription-repair coupling factor [unclassified Ruminococcus]SDA15770.1 transcription-repair coupling factor (superfamily II helicase) [Ruminococcus sp. YE78]SFW23158.1 transcription-repair coupling factor (superfamily II helicase) [Ruminococcus sp. YE71]